MPTGVQIRFKYRYFVGIFFLFYSKDILDPEKPCTIRRNQGYRQQHDTQVVDGQGGHLKNRIKRRARNDLTENHNCVQGELEHQSQDKAKESEQKLAIIKVDLAQIMGKCSRLCSRSI